VHHAVQRVYVLAPQRPQPSPARSAVEREFGRLKNEWALSLSSLHVRGLERVRLTPT
jgi:hypothetical protein